MSELYSRPLSPEAKKKLIEFVQAYIDSLIVAEVDEKAELAKEKAIDVLNTDIDILIFVITVKTLYKKAHLIRDFIKGRSTSKQVAGQVVEAVEVAQQADKSLRPGRDRKKSRSP